jgi:anti-sigma regulatory factor (Ser/Thr protein kinase)
MTKTEDALAPPDHTVEIRLTSTLEEIARLLDIVDAFCHRCGVVQGQAFQFSLALDEIVTNIIRHAFHEDGRHEILILLTHHPALSSCQGSQSHLQAVIEDDGPLFDPLSLPEPELDEELEHRKIGGLGIYMVRRMIGAVSYERVGPPKEGGRNRLTLCLRQTPAHLRERCAISEEE